jgi:DNA-binding transcriptional LysR family regulator
MMHLVHLSGIDLNLLVVLDALLATSSVKAAAARLALSPSATSHALQRLRAVLDDPLFVRAGQALVATPRAERLRPRLAQLLEDVEHLLADAAEVDPGQLRRSFSVATNDYGERVLLAPLGQRLHALAPGVDLYSVRSTNVEADLRTGGHDLSIGVVRSTAPDLEVESLFEERFVCLFRAGHPAAKKKLTLDRYARLEHILVAPGGTPRGVVDRMLEQHGLARRVARTVATFAVAPRLVGDSDYVLTLAERLARPLAAELGLLVRPAPEPLTGFTMSMVWHRRTTEDAAHRWLRDQVRAVSVETVAGARAGRQS